jgi:putative transposase
MNCWIATEKWSRYDESIIDNFGMLFSSKKGDCTHEETYNGPQIVAKLRQADVLIGQGKDVPELCKEIEISQQTYYRWRQKYGGMTPDMIKQLRVVHKENAQLRKLVADQELDISILKVVAEDTLLSLLSLPQRVTWSST